jgi:hypothetical protein
MASVGSSEKCRGPLDGTRRRRSGTTPRLPRLAELGVPHYPANTPRLLHLVRTALFFASGGFLEQTRGRQRRFMETPPRKGVAQAQRRTLTDSPFDTLEKTFNVLLLRTLAPGPRWAVLRQPSRSTPSPRRAEIATAASLCDLLSARCRRRRAGRPGPARRSVGAVDGRSCRRARPWAPPGGVASRLGLPRQDRRRRVGGPGFVRGRPPPSRPRPPAAGRSPQVAGPRWSEGAGSSGDGRVGEAWLDRCGWQACCWAVPFGRGMDSDVLRPPGGAPPSMGAY